MLLFAHFTGIPHHAEETQILTLWPIFLAIAQFAWYVARGKVTKFINLFRR